MPFCPNCGLSVIEANLRCFRCGTPVRPLDARNMPRPDLRQTNPRRSRTGMLGILGLVVSISFVGLVGALGFWLYRGDRTAATIIGTIEAAQGVAATIGSLDAHGVTVELPSGTFNTAGKISLGTSGGSRDTGVDPSKFELLTTPFAIHLEGRGSVRTLQPVTVKFKLPARVQAQLEDREAIRLAYRYQGKWHLQPTEQVDLQQGLATVVLHHFSEIAPAAAKKGQMRSEVAQALATGKWEQEHNRKATKKAVQGPLEQLIVKMTGVKDPTVIKAIVDEAAGTTAVTSLMKSGAQAYLDGRDKTAAEAELATKLAEISLNYLARKAGNLEADFGNETALAAAIVQGGAQGGMGDVSGAAKVMAKAVIGTTAVGKVFVAATNVTEVAIAAFKNNGVAEMYEAYRDGASGLYGFNVEAGDFEGLLSQSPGVIRQVRIDAVSEYCRVHETDASRLSEGKIQQIQSLAVERLKRSFESRRAEESEITQRSKFYERLLGTFERFELDVTATRRDSFANLSYEQRLHRYHQISQSILDLTGKTVNFSGDSYDKFISDHDLVEAMRKWLSSKKEAMDFLRAKGLVPAEPSVTPVAVTASGQIRYGKQPKAVLRVTIRFTNVGAQVQGQGAVSGSATDAADGEVYAIQGAFTGGPNGTMTVMANGDTYHAQVSGGRTVNVPKLGSLTIENPSAFDGLK
jgi:hypothetical protein